MPIKGIYFGTNTYQSDVLLRAPHRDGKSRLCVSQVVRRKSLSDYGVMTKLLRLISWLISKHCNYIDAASFLLLTAFITTSGKRRNCWEARGKMSKTGLCLFGCFGVAVTAFITSTKLRRARLVLGLVTTSTIPGIYPGHSGPLSLTIPPWADAMSIGDGFSHLWEKRRLWRTSLWRCINRFINL